MLGILWSTHGGSELHAALRDISKHVGASRGAGGVGSSLRVRVDLSFVSGFRFQGGDGLEFSKLRVLGSKERR